MSGLALYSPEDVIILLGGIYRIEGLQEGSFISIQKDEPLYETKVTTDGRVSRSHRNSPVYTITVTTMSTAEVNNIFSAWTAIDGMLYSAIVPLFIKDAHGTSLFYSPACWVEKKPEQDFDIDITSRSWEIKCVGGFDNIGGNYQGGVVDADIASLGFLTADALGAF